MSEQGRERYQQYRQPLRPAQLALRLCRDCKWLERWVPLPLNARYCKHPSSKCDVVDGKPEFASIRRFAGHSCGPEGRQWEGR
jgi:hypothetical protein